MIEQNVKPTRAQLMLVQGLTVARIPLAIAFSALLLCCRHLLDSDHPLLHPPLSLFLLLIGAGLILLAIELTDLFDGRCARRFGAVTEWGAMLDPYSDSISRIIVYWGLACAGLAAPFVPLAMALRDLTAAYCRIVLAQHGQSVSARWSGKVKAVLQGITAAVLLLGPLYWPATGRWTVVALSWFISLATLASIIEYLKATIAAAIGKKS